MWEGRDVTTAVEPVPAAPFRPDLGRARVEVRTVERRILTIDGRPVGEAFE